MAKDDLKRPVAPVLVVALLAIPILAACGSSSQQASSGPIVVGEFLPLTGKIAEFGKVFLQGAQTAVKYVNANGGVLGRQLTEVQADSGGDAVDAVPGMRKLLTQTLLSWSAQHRSSSQPSSPSSTQQNCRTLSDCRLPNLTVSATRGCTG